MSVVHGTRAGDGWIPQTVPVCAGHPFSDVRLALGSFDHPHVRFEDRTPERMVSPLSCLPRHGVR